MWGRAAPGPRRRAVGWWSGLKYSGGSGEESSRVFLCLLASLLPSATTTIYKQRRRRRFCALPVVPEPRTALRRRRGFGLSAAACELLREFCLLEFACFVHVFRALCCCEILLHPRLPNPCLKGLLLFLFFMRFFLESLKKKTGLCSCVVVRHTSF